MAKAWTCRRVPPSAWDSIDLTLLFRTTPIGPLQDLLDVLLTGPLRYTHYLGSRVELLIRAERKSHQRWIMKGNGQNSLARIRVSRCHSRLCNVYLLLVSDCLSHIYWFSSFLYLVSLGMGMPLIYFPKLHPFSLHFRQTRMISSRISLEYIVTVSTLSRRSACRTANRDLYTCINLGDSFFRSQYEVSLWKIELLWLWDAR